MPKASPRYLIKLSATYSIASSQLTGVSSPSLRIRGDLILSSWFTNEKPNLPLTHNIPTLERLSGSSSISMIWSLASTLAFIPHPTPQ